MIYKFSSYAQCKVYFCVYSSFGSMLLYEIFVHVECKYVSLDFNVNEIIVCKGMISYIFCEKIKVPCHTRLMLFKYQYSLIFHYNVKQINLYLFIVIH